MERTTGMGREISDDGVTWLLVEPSQAWLDATAMPIPDPVTEHADPVALLVSALRDPLANLTASSASTTVRTAILNQRAALDALLSVEQLTGLPIPDLPADPDLIPPDPTRLRSPR